MTTSLNASQLIPYKRLIQTAARVGVPRDQLENFIDAGYIPMPKPLEFHAACRECDDDDGPDQVGYGGARGGGKSHAIFAQVALDDCQRVPGLKVLYLRKIAKNAREQFEDLRRAVLSNIPHEYNARGLITFANGSRILHGHFHTEADIDQYLGLEYDIIVVEEATTLTLSKFKTLRDSNRTSKTGFRPRMYLSTNPGGVGHAWFKERFITPARRGSEAATRFVFATVDDNRMIDAGYKSRLDENTGWKLRAYRYGDWDIAAGQFFSTWSHDHHVLPVDLKAPYQVPRSFNVWLSLDYGFNHPTVAYLFMEHDGDVYVIAEHWRQKMLPPQHVEAITEMCDRHGVKLSQLRGAFAGADVFAAGKDRGAKSIADQYEKAGLKLTAAPMDRINGWSELLNLLGDPRAIGDPRGEKVIRPRLYVSANCARLIAALPTMQHDPNRPEDVLKVDVDDEGNGGDDAPDALRYGVMARLRKINAPGVSINRVSPWVIGANDDDDDYDDD